MPSPTPFECRSTAAARTVDERFLRAFSKSLRAEVIWKPSITGVSRSTTSASHSPSPSISASSALRFGLAWFGLVLSRGDFDSISFWLLLRVETNGVAVFRSALFFL